MKRVFNLIIVDESGSMCVIEKQALMGLNETLETVKKMQGLHKDMEQRVTLITFDSSHKRYVFDDVPARATHKLTNKDYRLPVVPHRSTTLSAWVSASSTPRPLPTTMCWSPSSPTARRTAQRSITSR